MKLRIMKSPFEWLKLKKLYLTAFPKCERKPLWLIWRAQKQRKTDVWIVEQDGEFAGFAITMLGGDLVLLDYLAICDDKRGGGIGSRTMQSLYEQYGGKRLFLEIENVYVPAENLGERIRRKQFYKRNGMQEMGIMVNAFGAELEILAYDCQVSFEDYYELYCSCYGRWAAENLHRLPYPNRYE